MIVGIGGLGLMATVQHLRLPWVWHLMDDVPVQLCRLGRAGHRAAVARGRPPARRPLPGLLAPTRRRDRGGWASGSAPTSRWCRTGSSATPPARERAYRPGDTLRVIAAGQIAQHKGIDILIESIAEVRARGFENLEVDIYGNVEDQFFPTLVRRLGVDDHVRFRGSRPQAELARLYASYDLFAFPTWHREPFAFAPLEASWRGCVPLMSQLSGNAEWAVHGVHCLKADRTPRAFADALTSVLSGAVDLGPIARRAAAVIGRDFHLDAQIPRIEAALAGAASRPRLGAGTAAEAYRMALLAEKLTKVLVQEAACA